MSRVCELTGKGPMSGNTVSHANNKSRRRFLPNLNDVTLISDVLGRSFSLRISAAALRTVDHRGGLDAFLAKGKDDELSVNAAKIKKKISKAQANPWSFGPLDAQASFALRTGSFVLWPSAFPRHHVSWQRLAIAL